MSDSKAESANLLGCGRFHLFEVNDGRSYSVDLRERVAAFVEAGHSCRAAVRHFAVGASFAIKLMQRVKDFGSSTGELSEGLPVTPSLISRRRQ